VIILIGIFKPDAVVIVAFLLVIPYLLLSQRRLLLYHLGMAFFVALSWVLFAKNEYGYNRNFLAIMGVNLYPLFSWALGLFAVYLIYSHYEHKLNEQTFLQKLGLFVVFYWPLLIIVETVAYHFLNVRNLVAAEYGGLIVCDCIHAPVWMQISYFLIGIIFFIGCYLLKLENPHFRIVKSKH